MLVIPGTKLWDEFYSRLEGEEGCNFTEDYTWECGGGYDQHFARSILEKMQKVTPEIDIKGSLKYYTVRGGHCDCEILFNVSNF